MFAIDCRTFVPFISYAEAAFRSPYLQRLLPVFAAFLMNPQTREVAEGEADQSHHQRPLLDLLRNRFGGATTSINDVFRHPARLRPGLLCRFACVAEHFCYLTGRSHGSGGSILNYFLGLAGCGGGDSRGAFDVLADCF